MSNRQSGPSTSAAAAAAQNTEHLELEENFAFFADDYSSDSSSEVRLGPRTLTLANHDVRSSNFEVVGAAGPSTGGARGAEGLSTGSEGPSTDGAAGETARDPMDARWDAWDPRVVDYNSVQNLLGADINLNAGAFSLAVKDREKAWSEVPCPYYKGEGFFCWKGPSCRMLHVLGDPTDLGKERISTSYTLDDKPVLSLGMWLQVVVKHVVSPSEFYVIPLISTSCICESAFLPRDKTDPAQDNLHNHQANMEKIRNDSVLEEFGTGLKAFETMLSKLKNILEINWNWRDRQTPYYAKSQLVAVKLTDKGVRTWYRGVVVEPNVTEVVDRQVPYHLVTLIDVGETLTVRADDLCPLPISLSFYPAMAFKCCLNGVVPVGMRWASSSTKTFQSLTAGDHLLMTVAKPFTYQGNCKTFENQPYLVDLMMQWTNLPENLRPTYPRPSISIGEVLSENGLAIKLNTFPYRPQLSQFLCFNNDLLLAPLNPKTIPKTTKEAESRRMFDVLADHVMKRSTNANLPKSRRKSF